MPTLTIQKEALSRGLSVVSKTVGNKGTIPILGNILLECNGSSLKLGATNLEMSIVCIVEIEQGEEFSTTVPAKLFNELIATIQGEELNLEYDDLKLSLRIKTDTSNNNIKCLNAEDFPDMPVFPEEPTICMPPETFRLLIQRSSFCAATADGANPLYKGVLFETKDNELAVICTDAFRFSVERMAVKCADFSVTIPAAYANEVARVSNEEVEIAVLKNSVMFRSGDITAGVLSLGGEFPKLRDFDAGTESATEIVAPTGELLHAVKHASLFCDEQKKALKLNFSLVTEVSAQADQVGDSVVSLPLEVSGTAITHLNADFMVGVLSVATEKIKIYVAGERRPVIIRLEGVENYFHVMMPIQV